MSGNSSAMIRVRKSKHVYSKTESNVLQGVSIATDSNNPLEQSLYKSIIEPHPDKVPQIREADSNEENHSSSNSNSQKEKAIEISLKGPILGIAKRNIVKKEIPRYIEDDEVVIDDGSFFLATFRSNVSEIKSVRNIVKTHKAERNKNWLIDSELFEQKLKEFKKSDSEKSGSDTVIFESPNTTPP